MPQDMPFSSKYQDDSAKSIGFVFMKTYSSWQSAIKACLKKHAITHPQFIVLATLAYLSKNTAEVTQVTLSQHANIDVMTVSQILDKLEKKAFITRNIASKDSRAKSINLTDDGYTMVNTTVPEVERIDTQFFSPLGTDTDSFRKMLLTLQQS